MASNREDNMNLLKHLAHEFKNEGWAWYIKTFEKKNIFPYQWAGERPDLILAKDAEIIVVCVENQTSLQNDHIIDKWRAFLNKDGNRLMIAVRDHETFETAREIAIANDISCEFRIVKRQYKKNYRVKKLNLFKKEAKTVWFAIAVAFFILIGTVLIVAPKIMNALILKNEFYAPKDLERQKDYLKRFFRNAN